MAKTFSGSEIRSCKTKRMISVDGNVYKSLVAAGYTPVYDDKASEWRLDHPTANNKCHPRRGISKTGSPVKKKRTPRQLAEGEPKKPANPFTIFQRQWTNDLSESEIKAIKNKAQAARAAWADLPEREKAMFRQTYEELKADYERELEQFEEGGGKRTPRAARTMKKKAEKKLTPSRAASQAAGKRPKSAFLLFSDMVRDDAKAALKKKGTKKPSAVQISQVISKMYAEDKNSEMKEAAEEQAAKALKAWNKKRDAYVASHPVEKKKVNNYINFANEKRAQVKKENPDMGPRDVSRELGVMWRKLSESQKKKYAAASPVRKSAQKKK